MTSLGGVTSRIEARSRWEGARVPPGLLRLSVGLEDPDELWADLEQALTRANTDATHAQRPRSGRLQGSSRDRNPRESDSGPARS